MKYKIYTDGSSKQNGKVNNVGGWAYIILNEDDKIIFKNCASENNTTNQRMELIAALQALLQIQSQLAPFDEVNIYSDSAYLINCVNQKWYNGWLMNNWVNSKKDPVANKDLWLDLIPFFGDIRIHWNKVKGHSTDYYNNIVDDMAQSIAKK